MGNKLKNTVIFCLGLLLAGLVIQFLGMTKGDSLVFPGVFEILRAFFRLLANARTYHLIFTTLFHLFISLLFSTVIGISVGLLEGLCPFVRKLLSPLMIMLRSIPMIVLVVIIMVLTKYSRVPYIASCMILIPLLSEAACEGCVNIDRELIDVYKINTNFSLRVLFSVYLPMMTGYIRQAYINAVGMGIKIIVTTEYLVQTKNSLGKAVYSSAYFNEYAEIYAYALIMILLVILFTVIPMLISRMSRFELVKQ